MNNNGNRPVISVLMPVYNGSKFLRESISSVLDQTFTDFEFVIIDDGSTDESLQIARQYNDPRLKIYSKNHLGMDEQLNWALNFIQSPYIAMMEQDNVISSDRLDCQYAAILNDKKIDVISSSYVIIDSSGKKKETRWLPAHDEEIRALFPVFCPIAFGSVVVRRASVLRAGCFNPKTFPNNDFDLWLRMLSFSKFANIEKPLLFKRKHDKAATIVHAETAMKQRLMISTDYLNKEIELCEQKKKYALFFKLALCHYYNGSMADARRLLKGIIWHPPEFKRFWRYFLVSLLGDNIFQWLRRTGLTTRISRCFRRHQNSGRYIAP